tara:strand:- start:132 stop:326 length:195 start_codon:yes stop_codon:yes gene_type:complete
MRVIATDILDKDGNLEKIEFYDELGGFQFQAMWDPVDEQNAENRREFREWAKQMAKRMDYEVAQ